MERAIRIGSLMSCVRRRVSGTFFDSREGTYISSPLSGKNFHNTRRPGILLLQTCQSTPEKVAVRGLTATMELAS